MSSSDLVSALRDRLDRLAVEEPRPPGFWEKLAHKPDESLPGTPELLKLDRELTLAGVHSLADARLLGTLARSETAPGKSSPRAQRLALGLGKRITQAAGELSEWIEALERQKRLGGKVRATQLAQAEDLRAKLARAQAIAQALEVVAKPGPVDPHDFEPLARPRPHRSPPSQAGLAAVEHLFQRSREQALDLRRKRRNLDLAHELLLTLSSQLAEDRGRAHALRAELAEERHRLQGLEKLVRHDESLPQAVTRAIGESRGDEAYQGLMAIYRGALEGGDTGVAAESRAALGQLWTQLAETPIDALRNDPDRRLADRLGPGALLRLWKSAHPDAARDPLLETTFDFAPEQWTVYDLAVSAGEFFDTSAVVEVQEEAEPASAGPAESLRRVPYPTPVMDFGIARSIHELRDFVIGDPRLVLYNLASGNQPVRAFYEEREPPKKKTRRSAVRVYVCDASGSMRGPRARFRDALLIAELNNLSVRARRGQTVWPIYFSFFTDAPTPLRRVDSAPLAYAAIADLFERSPARGRTDITFALESAFGAIHEARGRDPELALATVVLLTDGEDEVDLERIELARSPVGDVEVTLNFISLGHENEDLRQAVLDQRNRGRRSFYTHLTDAELVQGAPEDAGLRTLLPERPAVSLKPGDPAVEAALQALERIAKGLAPTVGPRARSRFELYFPSQLPGQEPGATAEEQVRVLDILEATSETLALAPAAERADEAVELVEHLLALYGISAERYRLALGAPEPGARIARVRLLAGSAIPAPSVSEAANGV